MAFNETWKKKLDKKGNPIRDENGDYVMELVSIVEVPEPEAIPETVITVDLNDNNSIQNFIEKLEEFKTK